MRGEMIEFDGNGRPFQGYLSKAEGGGPGVIVIQEWWGLVDHIKNVADRFAAAGFTALAPDFYHGQIAEEPDTAGKLMMALNIGEAEKILRGAVARLLADPSTRGDKVGVIGFCMGGQLALLAAATNPQIGACANFYGIHPNVNPPFENVSGPVLGIFAENDDFTNATIVSNLSQRLTELGKSHEFHTYPGTTHAFFNDDRPAVYDQRAADDAWGKVVAFFGKHLG
ncbi:MAG: hypothetical protein HONBIEJF_02718 [Fimbriimonadaceae bacterium]|nr:hypothetical protein [Fimbriimonadaceae bacterium]